MAQVGRKRVKMKPPWPLVSKTQLKSTARPDSTSGLRSSVKLPIESQCEIGPNGTVICIAWAIFLLVLGSNVCDKNSELIKPVACSRVQLRTQTVDRSAGGRGDEQSNGRLQSATVGSRNAGAEARSGASELQSTGSGELLAAGARQNPTAAHFNLSKMPHVVFGSAYQSEVYLPCQILNLDEDQTVSLHRAT